MLKNFLFKIKIVNFEIQIQLTFFLYFFLVFLLPFSYIENAIYVCIILLASIIHELGHILVAKLCSIKVLFLRLSVSTFFIKIDNKDLTKLKSLLITVGGPIASFLLYFVVSFCFTENSSFLIAIKTTLLISAAFNLVPFHGFDGQVIFFLCIDYICNKLGVKFNKKITSHISVILSVLICCVLIYISVYN